MDGQTFVIKSLYVQNTVMLVALGVVLFFLGCSVIKKRPKETAVFLIWLLIVLWFFNSRFFGFSTVNVGQGGIKVNYGILSFRNKVLPMDSEWEIKTTLSGLIRKEKLYYLQIGEKRSMKVEDKDELELLERIGAEIERRRSGPEK